MVRVRVWVRVWVRVRVLVLVLVLVMGRPKYVCGVCFWSGECANEDTLFAWAEELLCGDGLNSSSLCIVARKANKERKARCKEMGNKRDVDQAATQSTMGPE